MLKKIAIGFAVLVLGLLAVIATRPSTYHVERSVQVTAPAEVVFATVSDLRRWSEWSPWEKLDPNMKKSFSGPETGVGSTQSWAGSDEVGEGRLTVTELAAPTHAKFKLEFIKPFEDTSLTAFAIEPGGETVKVTWSMDGENSFMGKAMSLFMDMDEMIGKDYEKGLASIKALTEAEAKKRAEEAAAAAAATAATLAADDTGLVPPAE